MEYSNDRDNIYENIEEHSPDKEHKILIKFDDMIALICLVTKNRSVVNDLFIRSRKLNIFLVFITHSYLAVPKNIELKIFNTVFHCENSKQTRALLNSI